MNELEPCKTGDEPAGFFGSAWMCFLEQMPSGPLTAAQFAERAFYAGAAMFWAGMRKADETDDQGQREWMLNCMLDEVNAYCVEHNVRIEWEPKEKRS
jgi:hypothetical protein